MRINKKQITDSFYNLSLSTTNKFWGFLSLIASINDKIEPNRTYEIDSSKIMQYLHDRFSLINSDKSFIGNKVFVKFSMNWLNSINVLLLKKKPNILDCALFYCKDFNYSVNQISVEEVVNVFIEENNINLNNLASYFDFEYNKEAIITEDYNNSDLISEIEEKLKIKYNLSNHLSLESPFFIQSKPSELKRAPFIQTLYSGDRIKELLLLSDTDLEILYPLSSGSQQTVTNYEDLYKDWLVKLFNKKNGTTSSYLLSLKYISNILKQNLYLVSDIKKLNELLKEIKETQRIVGSKFYIQEATSYSTNGFLSAALSSYITFLEQVFTEKLKSSNTIYYGAPGTGKSYKVDQIIKGLDPHYYERITFHPEFDNASFVGGYKPFSEEKKKEGENGDEKENVISYQFVPQTFASIYSRAWNDLGSDYYLVIEEINRGNCAEIFGEIFQLLDRGSDYTVTPSRELKAHLVSEFGEKGELHDGIVKGLKLPNNLHILATMNTSDQSLFPMDSAFKRRWEWEYVPICYDPQDEDGKVNASYSYEIDLVDGQRYSWIDFIAKINNNHIKDNLSLGMDKCIGNYFVKPNDGNSITLKPFINKVIFYLWNDVFKDEDNKVFEDNGSYEEFFPISTKGLTKVKELFGRIGLSPKIDSLIAEENEAIQQVAEEPKHYGK